MKGISDKKNVVIKHNRIPQILLLVQFSTTHLAKLISFIMKLVTGKWVMPTGKPFTKQKNIFSPSS